MSFSKKSTLIVDVYVDLICPWCLIGKRHLSVAIAQLQQEIPDLEIDLKWQSVQLLPYVPDEGVDFTAFYLDRLGSPDAVRMRLAQVLAAAATAGVTIDFARIQRMPNTRRAHQVMAFAVEQLDEKHTEVLLDRLLAAHFNRGENLNDMDMLRGLAATQGLDLMALDAWMATSQGLPKPIELSGVPFFVFNRLHALSGAQSPDALLAVMRQSLHKARAA